MDREQDVLADLFYGTMGGTRYLYTPSGFTAQIEGEGIVILPVSAGTVFYGYFKDGKPRGECLALRFLNVNSPPLQLFLWNLERRQDDGLWKHRIAVTMKMCLRERWLKQ